MSVAHKIGLVMVMALLALPGSGCPQYREYQAKAYQSEAMANLGAIFTAEIAYFGENDSYGSTFSSIGWAPEGDNDYAYFLGDDLIQAKKGGPFSLPPGVKALVDDNGFTAVAVGNLDDDAQLDVWTINQDKELIHVRNDAGRQEGGH